MSNRQPQSLKTKFYEALCIDHINKTLSYVFHGDTKDKRASEQYEIVQLTRPNVHSNARNSTGE